MDVISKLILNYPVVNSLNGNSASGVLKELICDICGLYGRLLQARSYIQKRH